MCIKVKVEYKIMFFVDPKYVNILPKVKAALVLFCLNFVFIITLYPRK